MTASPTPPPHAARDAGTADRRVAFVITAELKPGAEAEFLGLLNPLLDRMRHEPGFINAALHRDPENATSFMLYETWADLDDVVQVQMARDYRQDFMARLPELLAGERRVQVWRPLRGDFTFFAG